MLDTICAQGWAISIKKENMSGDAQDVEHHVNRLQPREDRGAKTANECVRGDDANIYTAVRALFSAK